MLLDGNKGGSVVGELTVGEELAGGHWRGRTILQVLSGGEAQMVQPVAHAAFIVTFPLATSDSHQADAHIIKPLWWHWPLGCNDCTALKSLSHTTCAHQFFGSQCM